MEDLNSSISKSIIYSKFLQISYLNAVAEASLESQRDNAEKEIELKLREIEKLKEKKYLADSQLSRMISVDLIESKLMNLEKLISSSESQVFKLNSESLDSLINCVKFGLNKVDLEEGMAVDQTNLWNELDKISKNKNYQMQISAKTDLLKQINSNLHLLLLKLSNQKEKRSKELIQIKANQEKQLQDKIELIIKNTETINRKLLSSILD